MLCGLLLASVTSRKHHRNGNLDMVKETNSLEIETFFVALQDICPSLIATIPIANGVPISLKDKSNPVTVEEHVMIILQPEKLALQPAVRPMRLFY